MIVKQLSPLNTVEAARAPGDSSTGLAPVSDSPLDYLITEANRNEESSG